MNRARRIFWKVAAIAFWVPMLALGICCALCIPLNLILVPCWVAMASAVGPLAERASAPDALAEVAGRRTGPADESAMEGALIGKANA